VLPTELLFEILLFSDLSTVTDFRRVNHRARVLVDSLKEYEVVWRRCPSRLRDVLKQRAINLDLRTLYQIVRNGNCMYCDSFGEHLHLATCKRVCDACLRGSVIAFPPFCNGSPKVFNKRDNRRGRDPIHLSIWEILPIDSQLIMGSKRLDWQSVVSRVPGGPSNASDSNGSLAGIRTTTESCRHSPELERVKITYRTGLQQDSPPPGYRRSTDLVPAPHCN
jgi:hypothetical protein